MLQVCYLGSVHIRGDFGSCRASRRNERISKTRLAVMVNASGVRAMRNSAASSEIYPNGFWTVVRHRVLTRDGQLSPSVVPSPEMCGFVVKGIHVLQEQIG